MLVDVAWRMGAAAAVSNGAGRYGEAGQRETMIATPVRSLNTESRSRSQAIMFAGGAVQSAMKR